MVFYLFNRPIRGWWHLFNLIFYIMNRVIFLVGLGGCIGSIARYLTTVYFTKHFSSDFPLGTFAVNIIGCILIGVIYGISEKYNWLSPEWRFFLAMGLCGGFTTFSSFALENFQLIKSAQYLTFVLYSVSTYILGIGSVFLGFFVSKISF